MADSLTPRMYTSFYGDPMQGFQLSLPRSIGAGDFPSMTARVRQFEREEKAKCVIQFYVLLMKAFKNKNTVQQNVIRFVFYIQRRARRRQDRDNRDKVDEDDPATTQYALKTTLNDSDDRQNQVDGENYSENIENLGVAAFYQTPENTQGTANLQSSLFEDVSHISLESVTDFSIKGDSVETKEDKHRMLKILKMPSSNSKKDKPINKQKDEVSVGKKTPSTHNIYKTTASDHPINLPTSLRNAEYLHAPEETRQQKPHNVKLKKLDDKEMNSRLLRKMEKLEKYNMDLLRELEASRNLSESRRRDKLDCKGKVIEPAQNILQDKQLITQEVKGLRSSMQKLQIELQLTSAKFSTRTDELLNRNKTAKARDEADQFTGEYYSKSEKVYNQDDDKKEVTSTKLRKPKVHGSRILQRLENEMREPRHIS